MESTEEIAQISVFWDLEYCPVPRDVDTKDVSGNLLKVLRDKMFKGNVDLMCAYGDFTIIRNCVAKDLDQLGIKLIHAPYGTEKSIENDLAGFPHGSHSPSVIMLISNNVNFSNTLDLLGHHEYTIIFVTRFGDEVSSALKNESSYVWDWYDVAHGYSGSNMEVNSLVSNSMESLLTDLKEHLVELLEAFGGHLPYGRLCSEYMIMFGSFLCVSDYGTTNLEDLLRLTDVVQIADQIAGQHEYWRCVSLKKSKTVRGPELGSLTELATRSTDDMTPAQHRKLTTLREQLVELIEACGGHSPYGMLCSEFLKRFKKPLCPSEYGTSDLEDLLELTNVFQIQKPLLFHYAGPDGNWRCVSLKWMTRRDPRGG